MGKQVSKNYKLSDHKLNSSNEKYNSDPSDAILPIHNYTNNKILSNLEN